MTRKIGDVVLIEEEDEGRCELCGKIDELRPYGPNGENVCFDCGMKDEAAAQKAFDEVLDGKIQ